GSCPRCTQCHVRGSLSLCDLGCCLIPCLIDDFKDVTHTCPNCKAYIYTYKRMC
uniref:Cell death-inducing p53-target protein 1 n=1 Tax=Pelusios castaneus TaxID=367368 RepID=A0A8C8SMN7_9SAUR